MRLYTLTCGYFEIRKRMFLANAEDGETRLRIPVPAFLLTHPQGNVLFDTGLHAAGLADPWGRWGGLNKALAPLLTPDDHILRQLASLDVKPRDIRYVVNSHLHHDHSGGNEAFPKATFLVQRAELEAIKQPQLIQAVGYLPADCTLDVPYEIIDGEHDIFGDGLLMLIPTPGHTPGHQSLRATLPSNQKVILAGDACYLRETLQHLHLPKVVWDKRLAVQALEKLRQLQERPDTLFVPGHDPVVWAEMCQTPGYFE
jgi:N-acyl homoserine lactone hydrolase